jgi:uncharacterized membrane protein (DUF373 family)
VNTKIEKPLRAMKRVKGETWRYWSIMSFYERFEHVVALLLTVLIAVVIVIALWRLINAVWFLLIIQALDPLDHEVFQEIFGHIMTLLIAMEFKHSILRVIARKERIIQVKTVLLIALLALARKFIILDLSALSASLLAALALSTLALGGVYWLLRERDDRLGVPERI